MSPLASCNIVLFLLLNFPCTSGILLKQTILMWDILSTISKTKLNGKNTNLSGSKNFGNKLFLKMFFPFSLLVFLILIFFYFFLFFVLFCLCGKWSRSVLWFDHII